MTFCSKDRGISRVCTHRWWSAVRHGQLAITNRYACIAREPFLYHRRSGSVACVNLAGVRRGCINHSRILQRIEWTLAPERCDTCWRLSLRHNVFWRKQQRWDGLFHSCDRRRTQPTWIIQRFQWRESLHGQPASVREHPVRDYNKRGVEWSRRRCLFDPYRRWRANSGHVIQWRSRTNFSVDPLRRHPFRYDCV
jgi:hypothetical protein